MMPRGEEHNLIRPGNLFRLERGDDLGGVIPEQRFRAGSVGIGDPEVHKARRLAVDVIPAGIDHAPVVQHRRIPLVRLVPREGADPAVLRAAVERCGFDRLITAGTPREPAAAGRHKDQVAVREFRRIEIVVRPVGQLFDRAAFQIHFKEVELPLFPRQVRLDFVVVPPLDDFVEGFPLGVFRNDLREVGEREIERPAVEREGRGREPSAREFTFRDRLGLERPARILQEHQLAADHIRVAVII